MVSMRDRGRVVCSEPIDSDGGRGPEEKQHPGFGGRNKRVERRDEQKSATSVPRQQK